MSWASAPASAWLAVSTVVLLAAGFVAAQVPADGPGLREPANDVRRRLAGSLLTFAGPAAAILVGHVVDHVMTNDLAEVYWPGVIGAVVGVVVGAIGYRLAPTAVGLVGTIAGAITATMTLVDGVDRGRGRRRRRCPVPAGCRLALRSPSCTGSVSRPWPARSASPWPWSARRCR